jgi:hypothetical protein
MKSKPRQTSAISLWPCFSEPGNFCKALGNFLPGAAREMDVVSTKPAGLGAGTLDAQQPCA